jgi:hypothetical protein
MGNVSAATINLVIANQSIIPGIPVQGKVYLSVNHEKVDAESLMLRITGGEYTCIRQVTQQGEHAHVHSHKNTSAFLDLTFPLAVVQDGCFRKGQYEFPFTFTLPTGVLPSMGATLPGNDGGHCSVSYTVEVKLHRRGWFKWDVKHHQELWVLGTPVQHIPNFVTYLPPVEYPLNFFCFKRGTVRLGLYTTTSLLAAGESFDVNYVIQNNSTSRIKAMEIFLYEVIIWRADGITRTLRNILFQKRLDSSEIQVDLSPVDPNQNSIDGSVVITNQQVLAELKEILDSRRHRYPCVVPSSARTTMDGNLIDVEHWLTIRIATPFGTSDPEISTKLTIHRYGIQSAPYAVTSSIMPAAPTPTQLPANWNAVVAPPAQIPIPSYSQPNIYNSNEIPQPQDYSAPPPNLNYQGVQNLFQILTMTYDQPKDFEIWCQMNNADVLTPQEFGILFKLLRKVFDQIAVANILVTARTELICGHIYEAMRNCLPAVKLDIIKKLAIRCIDKPNYSFIQDQLTPFEWMCVESSFR